jgi:glycosyltransferase involved in cell wall biosynthesis
VRLTVIMAVHNAMPFLPEAIESLASQTYEGFRVLVVNDGSTDGSLPYLQSLTDERVSVITIATRGGQGAARNLALAQCDTEYTAFMDADDVSLPDRFARQIQFFDENPDIGVLGTQIAYIGESGRTGFSPPLALTHDQIRLDLLRQRHALAFGSIMYRTDILKKSGGFRIAGSGEDWDLFLRVTELTRAANLNETFYLYRVHKGCATTKQAGHIALRYAHACECARLRCAGGAETHFDDFCERQRRRSLWQRWVERLDGRASACYREALEHILNDNPLKGYLRLLLAAALSPGRLVQRAQRAIRGARPIARISGVVD